MSAHIQCAGRERSGWCVSSGSAAVRLFSGLAFYLTQELTKGLRKNVWDGFKGCVEKEFDGHGRRRCIDIDEFGP